MKRERPPREECAAWLQRTTARQDRSTETIGARTSESSGYGVRKGKMTNRSGSSSIKNKLLVGTTPGGRRFRASNGGKVTKSKPPFLPVGEWCKARFCALPQLRGGNLRGGNDEESEEERKGGEGVDAKVP
ncbi:hypothetical protein VTH06DRAFT_4269 [Thermothelomyces fergusii]